MQESSHRLLNRLFGQLLEGGERVFAYVVLAELLDVDLLQLHEALCHYISEGESDAVGSVELEVLDLTLFVVLVPEVEEYRSEGRVE